MTVNRREAIAIATMGTAAASMASPAPDTPATSHGIDALVARYIAAFGVPGAAVAVVRPGRPPILRGYGVRTLGRPETVDIHTQFAIASNSKAFLAASLAMLVDAGKLGWDDPVTRYLPEFEMADPAVTAMMTVRDLLVHRSGLSLGAGDLMQLPPTDHSAEDVLKALRFFKLATPFRSGYAYDNVLYIVAGLVLQRVSGESWGDYVSQRIFAPLGMVDAVPYTTMMTGPDHAGRHARLGPPTRGMGKLEVVPPGETNVIGPAGGIGVSVAGIVPWLQVQLDSGALPDGRRLWSETQANEMWKAQTLMSSGPGPTPDHPERSVLSAYALGWDVSDYRGRRMLSHAGGLSGQVTRTTLLPEQRIGFVVYTNSEDADVVSGLRYAILDHLLGAPPHDWFAATLAARETKQAQVTALLGNGDFRAPAGGPSLPLDRYVGRYRDPWYGDVVIARHGAGLTVDFTHTPSLKSALEPFGRDCFRMRLPRGAGEDAVLCFTVTGGEATAIAMKPLSPLADFSFDYQDLKLARIE